MPYVLFVLRSCYIALAAVAFVLTCTYTVLEAISVTVLHHFHTCFVQLVLLLYYQNFSRHANASPHKQTTATAGKLLRL
jgi:hypothetical protein